MRRHGAGARCPGKTLLLAGVFAAMGCGGGSPPTEAADGDAPLSVDRFVEVVAAVREAERETAEEDSAAVRFEARRREILEDAGVSEEQLRDFVRRHAEDTELLRVVWDRINERLKHEVEATDDPFERPGFRVN